jgi:SulP family sulfate permease
MHSLETLYEKCKSNGVSLVLSHVNEQPMKAMKKAGFYDKVGADNFCAHIDEALELASNK